MVVVAQSLVLSGWEIATHPSDVIEGALIRTFSHSADCRLNRGCRIVVSLNLSLNGARSLHVQLL